MFVKEQQQQQQQQQKKADDMNAPPKEIVVVKSNGTETTTSTLTKKQSPNNSIVVAPAERAMSEHEESIYKPVIVTCRVVFTNVGLVETKTERYSANLNIAASWEDDVLYHVLATCDKNKRNWPKPQRAKQPKAL